MKFIVKAGKITIFISVNSGFLRENTANTMTERTTESLNQESIENAIDQLSGTNILIVEDNALNQEVVLELLHNNGIKAEAVNNGQEALSILAKQTFDGILMDCQMPIMDGYTTTKLLRKAKHLKNLPIIAMTANTRLEDKVRSTNAGMNDLIAKPINVHDMFTIMAKWIFPAKSTRKKTINSDPTINVSVQELPALYGIDVHAGLTRMQGNMSLYIKLLIGFRNRYRDFESLFFAAQEESDPLAPLRTAHTFSGLAGNIGASHLFDEAKLLEQACENDNESIHQCLTQIVSSLQPIISGLENLNEEQEYTISALPCVDVATIKAPLQKLHSLVKQNNLKSADIARQLTSLLAKSEYSEQMHKAEAAILVYDYEKAEEHLQQLASDLELTL